MGRGTALIVVIAVAVLGGAMVRFRAPDPVIAKGVKVHAPTASDGVVLFSSLSTKTAQLVDAAGKVVHTWQSPPPYDGWPYNLRLTPGGTLLGIVGRGKDYHLVELAWDGKITWQYNGLAHHDFHRYEDGRTLLMEYLNEPAGAGGRRQRDRIVEVDASGKTIWQWIPEDHLAEIDALLTGTTIAREVAGNSSYHILLKELAEQGLETTPSRSLHMNAVTVIPDDCPRPAADPRFRPGNVILSFRNANTIVVVDRATGRPTWAFGPGVLLRQHAPRFLCNGHIMVYDNGDLDVRQFSRIVELDPVSDKIVWSYAGSRDAPFFSHARGGAQLLPNGDILTSETETGRIFEINRSGKIMWQYQTVDTDLHQIADYYDKKRGKPLDHPYAGAEKFLFQVHWYERSTVDAILARESAAAAARTGH